MAATASADATSATGAGTQNGSAKGLSSKDAAAIDAELTAIQKELDKLALPSDQDFGGIESGLK